MKEGKFTEISSCAKFVYSIDCRPTWHEIAKRIYMAGDFGDQDTSAHRLLQLMAQTLSEKYATQEEERLECWTKTRQPLP